MSAIEIPIKELQEKLERLRKEKLEIMKQIWIIQNKAPSSTDDDAIITYDESKLSQEDQEELDRLRREKEKLRNQMEPLDRFISDIKRSEQMQDNCLKAFEIGVKIGKLESKYPVLTPEEQQEYDQLQSELQEILQNLK